MSENKNIEENEIDIIEEIAEDEKDNIDEDPGYVTREINLDDLYDGAVNNTVVIDPITNNEILMRSKKPNFTILGIIIAIVILLVLYYVNNKSDFGRTTKNVEPKTTTTIPVSRKEDNSGTLTCTYQSKSDAESQNVTYVLNYENSNLVNSNFNYIVMSNTDNQSAIVEDLKTQYEAFFINNASANGNSVDYVKTEKGFTFNVETNYQREGYNELTTLENQTILFVKPSLNDTFESIRKEYTDKGFNCSLTGNNNEE